MDERYRRVKEWRRRTAERIVAAMGGACAVCGWSGHHSAFDLHHVRGKKSFGLSGAKATQRSWARIVAELRKCVLLCARCHRLVHAGEVQVPNEAASFSEEFVDYRKMSGGTNTCPGCGGEKSTWNKYCSRACASRKKRGLVA